LTRVLGVVLGSVSDLAMGYVTGDFRVLFVSKANAEVAPRLARDRFHSDRY
jgi:hypothetical protein